MGSFPLCDHCYYMLHCWKLTKRNIRCKRHEICSEQLLAHKLRALHSSPCQSARETKMQQTTASTLKLSVLHSSACQSAQETKMQQTTLLVHSNYACFNLQLVNQLIHRRKYETCFSFGRFGYFNYFKVGFDLHVQVLWCEFLYWLRLCFHYVRECCISWLVQSQVSAVSTTEKS